MTIVFQGHVEKLEMSSAKVKVTIRGAMHRMDQVMVVEMSREEANAYMPGTPVQIQVHPTGSAPSGDNGR